MMAISLPQRIFNMHFIGVFVLILIASQQDRARASAAPALAFASTTSFQYNSNHDVPIQKRSPSRASDPEFQRRISSFRHENPFFASTSSSRKATTALHLSQDETTTNRKANVRFTSSNTNNNPNYATNQLSPIDSLLLNLTSDRTSLLLGSLGILILLINRLVSFPEQGVDSVDTSFSVWEASRSRIDLLGVFAAGSVLLNGISKLDVTSVQAERVALEGVSSEGGVVWNEDTILPGGNQGSFESTVEWALLSSLKCSPARTAVLLTTSTETNNANNNHRWTPIAMAGILPIDPQLRTSIPTRVASTPILNRMLQTKDGKVIKGGSVAGSDLTRKRGGPNESYLPTLQALPGRVEFTYLPLNAQEVLVLPVPIEKKGGNSNTQRHYAVVLGGDTAKSFTPRDIAWCREIASWIGLDSSLQ